MKKKGFTLVELLAVIVILALLALLTSTAVTKLVKDSKDDLYDTQIALIKSAAESWGADNLLDLPDNGECAYLTLEDLKRYGLIDPNISDPRNNQPFSDDMKIKITTTLSDYGNPITNFEVNPANISGCIEFYYYPCTYVDEDNSGTINLSDTVTCGTESFHVMSNDGTNVTMLTKYNLNVGRYYKYPNDATYGIQDEHAVGYDTSNTAYGTEAFSTTNYWHDGTNYTVDVSYASQGRSYPYVYGDYKNAEGNQQNYLYTYVSAYETYLKETLKVNSASATLISYEQAIDLGCDGTANTCSGAPTWTYSTSYYLGSAYNNIQIWTLAKYGNFTTNTYNGISVYGVRPVVTILLSEIENN